MSETVYPQIPPPEEINPIQPDEAEAEAPLEAEFQPEIPAELTPGAEAAEELPPPPPLQEGAPSSEERTWSMLAHLSILLNLVSGILGVLAALVIYLVYKDRSRYVAYHALQSLLFQLIFWVGAGLLATFAWIVTVTLMVVLVGFCLLPFAILISLIPLAALVYGLIGAIKTSQGEDFRYWLVGDWVRGTLTR